MGCCNEKRAQWRRPLPFPSTASAAAAGARATVRESPMTQSVGLEYVGDTALSVVGPITRMQYRFPRTGARLEVDHRDAPYLSGVPHLRRTPKTPPHSSPASQ